MSKKCPNRYNQTDTSPRVKPLGIRWAADAEAKQTIGGEIVMETPGGSQLRRLFALDKPIDQDRMSDLKLWRIMPEPSKDGEAPETVNVEFKSKEKRKGWVYRTLLLITGPVETKEDPANEEEAGRPGQAGDRPTEESQPPVAQDSDGAGG